MPYKFVHLKMKQKKISLENLATMCKTSRSTLYRLLRNNPQNITEDLVLKIIEALEFNEEEKNKFLELVRKERSSLEDFDATLNKIKGDFSIEIRDVVIIRDDKTEKYDNILIVKSKSELEILKLDGEIYLIPKS